MSKQNQVMIEAAGLTKVYGQFTAVDDLSFSCKRGEIVGFLGPNGAGKTTTMRMLTGYMPPTNGAAYIGGYHTVDQSLDARRKLGYMPETVPLYPEMKVDEYLAFMGQLRRVEDVWARVDAVLEAVDLLDRAESYIGDLSKGMRQRVGLAQAILHDPEVLILDEPTIGLDPRQIADVRELIAGIGERHTILLSTHILSEVEQLCDRVLMIINGRIWADMRMEEMQQGSRLRLQLASPAAESIERLSQLEGVREVTDVGDNAFELVFDGRRETQLLISETAVAAQWGLLEMSVSKQSLESVFLAKLQEAEQGVLLSDGAAEVAAEAAAPADVETAAETAETLDEPEETEEAVETADVVDEEELDEEDGDA